MDYGHLYSQSLSISVIRTRLDGSNQLNKEPASPPVGSTARRLVQPRFVLSLQELDRTQLVQAVLLLLVIRSTD